MGKFGEYTRQVPQLVDIAKLKSNTLTPNDNVFFKKKKKWSINKILLVGFLIFTVFFLYNCRYGIFKPKDPYVLPYTVATQSETKN